MNDFPSLDDLEWFNFETELILFESGRSSSPAKDVNTKISKGFSAIPFGTEEWDQDVPEHKEALRDFLTDETFRKLEKNQNIVDACDRYLSYFKVDNSHDCYPLNKLRFFSTISGFYITHFKRILEKENVVLPKKDIQNAKKIAIELKELLSRGLIVENERRTREFKSLLGTLIAECNKGTPMYFFSKNSGDPYIRMLVRDIGLFFTCMHGKSFPEVVKSLIAAVDADYSPSTVEKELIRLKQYIVERKLTFSKVMAEYDGESTDIFANPERVEKYYKDNA